MLHGSPTGVGIAALLLALTATCASSQPPPGAGEEGSGGQTTGGDAGGGRHATGGSGGRASPSGAGGALPGGGGDTATGGGGGADAGGAPPEGGGSSGVDNSSGGAAAGAGGVGAGGAAGGAGGGVAGSGASGLPEHRSNLGPDVPPPIPSECPGDLTAGFTEYVDTFNIQRPYDLGEADRVSYDAGVWKIWVKMGDKPHAPGNTTRERTEFRWSDISTGVHLWSGDFKVQSPSAHVCIFQVKNSGPPTGVYLRVDGGNLHQLNGSNFLNGIYDKWFNLKVVVDTAAATGKVYINNCLKQTVNMPRGSGTWYFKNGTYTCDSAVCTAYFKNIHIYKK